MNKNELLDSLKEALKGNDESEINEVIRFYDELVSDAIESGKDEKEFIESLGSIDSILKKIEVEKKIKEVNEKPTMKNKASAIFAVLGIITSPIWFPIALALVIVVFALILVGFSVILSFGVAALSLFVAFIASFTLLTTTPFAIAIPLLLAGLTLIFIGLTIVLSNFLFNTVTVGFINWLKKVVFKKGEKQNV